MAGARTREYSRSVSDRTRAAQDMRAARGGIAAARSANRQPEFEAEADRIEAQDRLDEQQMQAGLREGADAVEQVANEDRVASLSAFGPGLAGSAATARTPLDPDPPEAVYGGAAEAVANASPSVGGGAPVRGGGAPQRAVVGLTEVDGKTVAGSQRDVVGPSGQSLKELEAELARLKAMTGSRGGRVAKGGSSAASEPTPSKSAGTSKGSRGPNYLKDAAPVSAGEIARARSGR